MAILQRWQVIRMRLGKLVGLAHFGPTELPWHRLVNRFGDCASGYYGGKAGHQQALEAEGIHVADYRIVDFPSLRWRPDYE